MNFNQHKIEIVPEEAVSPKLDAAIKTLLCECFPPDVALFRACRWWHDSAPEYSLVYREDQTVLGHLGIVHRTITCGAVPVEIAGIQSLAVSSRMRGSGLAQQLMNDSMVEARRRNIPFGFLFCVPKLEKFYTLLGWRLRDVAITMHDKSGQDAPLPGKNIAMYLELSDQPFPEGDIHLQGRDW